VENRRIAAPPPSILFANFGAEKNSTVRVELEEAVVN
jgi:hypothetical protein